MDRVAFEIFEPDGKKFHWSPDLVLGGLWLIPVFILWAIKGNNSGPPNDLVTIYFVCLFLLTIYFIVASFFTHKSLNGVIHGELRFEKDKIIADDAIFLLNDLKDLDFYFGDYYDKPGGAYKTFNPRLSQGVNNYVTFTEKTGDTIQVYFRVQSEHGYQALAPFINEAVKLRKMDFKRATALLGSESISI